MAHSQPSFHFADVRGLSVHLCGCVCDYTSECGSVFLRSRVNYTGHDVKGRSLVGENTAEFTQQLPWRQRC